MSDTEHFEKKLKEYRAKKEREERINKVKEKAKSYIGVLFAPKPIKQAEQEISKPEIIHEEELEDLIPNVEDDDCEESENCQWSWFKTLYYILWFTLWLSLYVVFIKLQFGSVYFIVTALVAMYANTRTGPKKRNEVSAYSVFNKNCESIPGTLKAEQFEREIRYGAGAVR